MEEWVDVTVEFRYEQGQKIRVFDGVKKIWLPTSQIKVDDELPNWNAYSNGDVVEIQIPRWLAEEREMVQFKERGNQTMMIFEQRTMAIPVPFAEVIWTDMRMDDVLLKLPYAEGQLASPMGDPFMKYLPTGQSTTLAGQAQVWEYRFAGIKLITEDEMKEGGNELCASGKAGVPH